MCSTVCKCWLAVPISLREHRVNLPVLHRLMKTSGRTAFQYFLQLAPMLTRRILYLLTLKCPQGGLISRKGRGNSSRWLVHCCVEVLSLCWTRPQVALTLLLIPRSRLPFVKSSVTLYFLQVWSSVLAITTLTDFNIVVAHRLRTVIDYDRLIVLDKGQVWNSLKL